MSANPAQLDDWFIGARSRIADAAQKSLTLGLAAPGHGAAIWASLAKLIPGSPLYGIRPPGRERRILEPPFISMTELVNSASRAINEGFPELIHIRLVAACLNAKAACVLAGRLVEERRHLNVSLVLIEPNLSTPVNSVPWLSATLVELAEMLRCQAAVPDEILEDSELLAVFAPMFRADFHLAQNYELPDEQFLSVRIRAIVPDDGRCEDSVLERQCRAMTTGTVVFDRIVAPSASIMDHPDLLANLLTRDSGR